MEIPAPLRDMPLATVDEKGKVPEARIASPTGLRSLWAKQYEADKPSARMRARAQAMVDNEPPFDQAARNAAGQGFLANFNPGDAKASLDSTVAAFHDLDAAEERLAHLPTRHGEGTQRMEWQATMEEEFGKTVRSWGEYTFKNAFISHHMRLHGVGITYFADCQNWQWDVTHLGDFKIPRQTPACEEKIPYAVMRKEMQVNELWSHIRNRQAAEKEGWNWDATVQAIRSASPNQPDDEAWEAVEARIKNNDLVEGAEAETVPVLHGWVREFDGTISFYIATEAPLSSDSSSGKDAFLYVERQRYKTASEAYTCYCNGIGTNGTFHSISGMGKDMYNAYQALMRLANRSYDMASAAGPVMQARDDEAMEQLQMTPYSGFTLISAGITPLQVQPPTLSNSVVPVMNDLRNTIQRNTGQYTADNVFGQSKEQTATEISAHLEHLARLSITSVNLYYQARDRHIREVVRRFIRKDYLRTDPGGHFVHDFILRCKERGVPKEAIYAIDVSRVKAVRAIGSGSPAARRVALSSLMELSGQYDAVGRQVLIRKLTAATAGTEIADELAPPLSAKPRAPIDRKIAQLEHAALIAGEPVEIQVDEDSGVHLEEHLRRMGEFMQAFDEAGQNPELFAQIVPPLKAIYEHAVPTLEKYSENAFAPKAGEYKQLLQQAGEIIINGERHLQKQAKQQEGQQGGEGMGNEIERSTIEFQVRLQNLQQDGEVKRAERVKNAEVERRIKDANAAAEIQRKAMLATMNNN